MSAFKPALSASSRLEGEIATLIADDARLIRVIGEPDSGRTSFALALCVEDPDCQAGSILVIDTLGHGPATVEPVHREMIHSPVTDIEAGFTVARRLIATGGLSAIILDDLLGFDVAPGADGAARLQRLRIIESRLRALASLCLGHGVKLIVLDRLSPMGVLRTPIGFRDVIAERPPLLTRNRAA